MPLVRIGGKFWRPPFMNPLDGGSATKISPSSHKSACQKANEQWESLNLKTRFCDCFGSKGQKMDQGSMDPHFGPIPWTPCHGPGPWILFYFYRKVLDRVHEHSFLNNENWTKTEIVQKYDLTRRCRPGGGALVYFLGGYVPPGTPNWHPVLKKNSAKIDSPF